MIMVVVFLFMSPYLWNLLRTVIYSGHYPQIYNYISGCSDIFTSSNHDKSLWKDDLTVWHELK